MAETTTYQCPNCNGKLDFDGSIGRLKCEFCGSSFTAEEVEALYGAKQERADAKAAGDRVREIAAQAGLEYASLTERQLTAMNDAYQRAVQAGKTHEEALMDAQAAAQAQTAPTTPPVSAAAASTSDAVRVETAAPLTGDPIKDYLAQSKWTGSEAEGLRAFNCSACGAQLMVDQVTAVTQCPYCGNNAVVPGQLSDVLKPDYIIPFKLDKNAAVQALKQYYGGKKFLPNGFTEGNHLEEVQGVYVPFWLYSGQAEGDVTFNARNIRAWSDSENDYVETDHYLLHRAGTMNFMSVPVDGSTKMPDAHMDAIEPFDYSELRPFSVGYLPGYLTDRYDQDVQQCDKRARSRVTNTCVDAMQETAQGYMEIDVARAHADVRWTNVAYALLPVWMLHTKWNNEDYLFAMNGQTGKLIGDLPIDNGKVYRRLAILFIPLAIIIAAIIFFVMGF